MHRVALFTVCLATSVVGCGASQGPAVASVPQDARDVTVSLFDLDCADCAETVVTELKKQGTVYAFSFDKKRVVLDVKVAPTITAEQVLEAAKRAGFRAELGSGGGKYEADAEAPKGADVVIAVTDGHDVPSLASVAVPGKVTILDLYADWCGPCRDVDKHAKELVGAHNDLAYRRLNIVDWDSPLAVHYLKNVPSLPYVIVIDGKGAQVDAIVGVDLSRLDAAIAKAKP